MFVAVAERPDREHHAGGGSFGAAPARVLPLHAPGLVLVELLTPLVCAYELPTAPKRQALLNAVYSARNHVGGGVRADGL